jgi:hypothetical protein
MAVGDWDYDLPDDFAFIVGTMHFPLAVTTKVIRPTSVGKIMNLRAGGDISGRPDWLAIRPKSIPASTTVGQRFEVIFYPTPHVVEVLPYCYQVVTNNLSTSNEYPVGANIHGPTIEAFCMEEAEATMDDRIGIWAQRRQERYARSIEIDQDHSTPDFLGYGTDDSDEVSVFTSRVDEVLFEGEEM